ncbi:hypothetical protein OQA88_11490 [Cercophora sp. LCS_1]
MRLLTLLYAGLLAQGGAAAGHRRRDVAASDANVNSTVTEPKKFIVEVAEADLGAVESKLAAEGVKVLRKFKTKVFTGLSIESDKQNIDTLHKKIDVRQAWPVRQIHLDPIVPLATYATDAAAGNYSVHAFTGVSELHEQGILGKGATVAVVDTGVDYRHSALGGGIGPGFKVKGGYDLVGDDEFPRGPKSPDPDPKDPRGHGTHVSGIVAGKSDWFVGVAPEASLLVYKVFNKVNSTDEDTLIDAFLMAFEAGADVITASLGEASGWSNGAWPTVASRLVDQGVLVTISAGNSGRDGPFFASSGSSGKNVLSVASTDANVVSAQPFEATFSDDGSSNKTYLSYLPDVRGLWNFTTDLPIIPVSFNTSDPADGCEPLPDTTPNLKGAIALIRRGSCNFSVKVANARKFGAERVLFYNNNTPGGGPASQEIPTALIDGKAGEAIIAAVKGGAKVTANFAIPKDASWQVRWPNPAGGIPSEYTSWGGTNELEIKPDIAAPGRDIYSTYLDGTWAVTSGTSMACPYVAGVAALYIGKYGGRSVHGPGFAKELANRIRSSGTALPWQILRPTALPVDYGFFAPVNQVGAGLINATMVLEATTSLTYEKFALNDTANFRPNHEVSITNKGKEVVTYKFSLQPFGAFSGQSTELEGVLAEATELRPFALAPSVDLPSEITVEPGETKKVAVKFSLPQSQGLNTTKLPFYSGRVLVSGSNGETLGIPYLGAAFDLKAEMKNKLWYKGYPVQMSGRGYDDIDDFHTYDFNLTSQNFPKVYTATKWGVKELRWDLFESGWTEDKWTYPPVPGKNGYIGSATYYAKLESGITFNPKSMDANQTSPFPVPFLPRTSAYGWFDRPFWWMGKLANGSYIAPGNYTMRFAAQLPFSDPAESESWQVWKTPEITILPYTP